MSAIQEAEAEDHNFVSSLETSHDKMKIRKSQRSSPVIEGMPGIFKALRLNSWHQGKKSTENM